MRSAIRSWRHRSGRQCAHRGAQRLDGPPAGARGRTAKGRTGCARSTLLWTSLALAFLAGPLAPRSQAQAPGGDAYFVDAVHGSDQNPGTSPESAWCTVEHAVTMLRSPRASTTLHLAPGVYPASRLAPSGQLIVVGAGVEHTVLEGTARTPLFDLHAGDQDGEAQVSLFRVEGATLRGGSAGVRLRASSSVAVQLQDVVIEDCHVAVDLATETGPAGPGTIVARLERASVRGGGTGVLAVGAEGDLDVQVLDSELRGAAADGIRTRGSVRLHVERCRVVENRANGIDAQPLFKNLVRVEVRDSLIAANHRAGFRGDRTDPPFGRTEALFANVTVTGNCHEGILAPHEGTTTIEGSIVYGNLGTDLVLGPPGVETIRSNVLSDEDLDGVNDNIVADPLFRDAETGDYRLTFGSPAVDSLDVVPGLDVDRRPRGRRPRYRPSLGPRRVRAGAVRDARCASARRTGRAGLCRRTGREHRPSPFRSRTAGADPDAVRRCLSSVLARVALDESRPRTGDAPVPTSYAVEPRRDHDLDAGLDDVQRGSRRPRVHERHRVRPRTLIQDRTRRMRPAVHARRGSGRQEDPSRGHHE